MFHANFLELFSFLTQNCVAEVAVCVHRTTFACPERTLAKNNGHNTKKLLIFFAIRFVLITFAKTTYIILL